MIEIIVNKDLDINKYIKRKKNQSGFAFLGSSLAYIGLSKIANNINNFHIRNDVLKIANSLINVLGVIATTLLIVSALLHLFSVAILPKLIVKEERQRI